MRTLLAIAFSLLVLVPAWAEDPKPAVPMPPVTSRSELVLVPTMVRDKSGAVVSGLSKGDFILLENGAEQKIAVFEEIRTSAIRPSHPPLPTGEFSNYLVREPGSQRITIIVMDAINTQFADRAYAREQILKFLAEVAGSRDPIALLLLQRSGARVIHDFTTDSTVLAKALRRLQPGDGAPVADNEETLPSPTTSNLALSNENAQIASEIQQLVQMLDNMEQNYLASQRMMAALLTLDCMQQIARAYAAIPGRKSLIWASGGFPFSIDDLSRLVSGSSAAVPSYLSDILPRYENTWRALNAANIALYPVDVHGMVMALPGAERHISATGLKSAGQRISITHLDTLDTFRQFAEMTGGKAYFNTNDLVHAFRDAVDDSAAYYILGFYVAPEDRKPGWRKLQVKVQHPGAQVRNRSGFYMMPEDKDKNKTKLNEIALALSSPVDFTSLPVLARWTGTTPNGDKKRAAFELILPANAALVDEADQNHLSLEFQAAASLTTGKAIASNGRSVEAHLKPEALAQVRSAGVTYKGVLELPPGEYNVRFVVRDNLSGRLGSLAAPLQIGP